MATRLDPQLLKEFKEYGAVGVEKCFNCGNCTAICPLASDEYNFPRDVIRRVQIGQKEQLTEGLRAREPDVSRDGQRFLLTEPATKTRPGVSVAVNWSAGGEH